MKRFIITKGFVKWVEDQGACDAWLKPLKRSVGKPLVPVLTETAIQLYRRANKLTGEPVDLQWILSVPVCWFRDSIGDAKVAKKMTGDFLGENMCTLERFLLRNFSFAGGKMRRRSND